jgi:AraC-like DNA-binding protein
MQGANTVSSMNFPTEERLRTGDLVARLQTLAGDIGPNDCGWPGLTTYRFTQPQGAQWAEVQSLSLCCVLQGRKRVTLHDGQSYTYDPFNYLLFTRGMRFEAEILEASIEKPFLSLVLQIDPAVVRAVSADMAERRTTTFHRPRPSPAAPEPVLISPLEQNLSGALLRFLSCLPSSTDRRVLAPMYLQEITYRILQADQCTRLMTAAIGEKENNPVSQVIRFVKDHLAESVSVADMAQEVRMSPSALTTVFTETTGMSPYQFVKRMRLDRAGTLLVEQDLNVGEVAHQVGYASLSHFINEFKRYFGATPRNYAAAQQGVVALRVEDATESARARA